VLQGPRVLLGLEGFVAGGGEPGSNNLLFHGGDPGVLLPPVDVVQSQNPFS
jgi:hypothetical protein